MYISRFSNICHLIFYSNTVFSLQPFPYHQGNPTEYKTVLIWTLPKLRFNPPFLPKIWTFIKTAILTFIFVGASLSKIIQISEQFHQIQQICKIQHVLSCFHYDQLTVYNPINKTNFTCFLKCFIFICIVFKMLNVKFSVKNFIYPIFKFPSFPRGWVRVRPHFHLPKKGENSVSTSGDVCGYSVIVAVQCILYLYIPTWQSLQSSTGLTRLKEPSGHRPV